MRHQETRRGKRRARRRTRAARTPRPHPRSRPSTPPALFSSLPPPTCPALSGGRSQCGKEEHSGLISIQQLNPPDQTQRTHQTPLALAQCPQGAGCCRTRSWSALKSAPMVSQLVSPWASGAWGITLVPGSCCCSLPITSASPPITSGSHLPRVRSPLPPPP